MKTSPSVRAWRVRPVSALVTTLVVLALAHAALVGCGGGGASQQANSEPEPTPVNDQANGGTDSGTSAAVDGAQVYAARCALCHGPEGKGDGPAAASLNPKPRNHTDGAYMNSLTDEQLLTVIHEGKGAMPAWKSVLSEEEIQAVKKHVRSLANPPYPG